MGGRERGGRELPSPLWHDGCQPKLERGGLRRCQNGHCRPDNSLRNRSKSAKICNQFFDNLASQASSVRVMTGEYNQKAADAWEEIQVENNLSNGCD